MLGLRTSCSFSLLQLAFCAVVAAVVTIIVAAAPALATEHVFDFVPQQTSCSPEVDHIKATRIEARFNTVTKRFRWSVNFAPPPIAELPSLYYLVVNDGPMPRGQPGSLAIFYFDATDVNAPKLTVYGYSGENNGQSFRDGSQEPGLQPPDTILSSLISQEWINELSVTTEGNGSRTLTFDINASSIISHSPLYPDPGADWFGTGFSTAVGLWFHMFKDVYIEYGDDNFISHFEGIEDCYDLEDLDTVIDMPPVCNPGSAAYNFPCEGVLTTIPLDGSFSSDPEQQQLTFQWTTTCENASINPANAAQAELTLLNPGLGMAQACAVTLTVSDGPNESSCSATVETPACNLDCLGEPNGSASLDDCGVCNGANLCVDCAGVPFGGKELDRCNVCDGNGSSCLGCTEVNVTGTQHTMDSNLASLRHLVLRATRRLLQVRNTKANQDFAKRARADAQKLYFEGWTATYEIPGSGVSCTNEDFCLQSSFIDSINTFNSSSAALRDTVAKVVNRISRVRGSVTAGDRRTKRVANTVHDENLAASATLPTSVSSCPL